MGVEQAIYTRLAGYAGLTALVSTRVYYMDTRQDTAFPNVTFSLVTNVPVHASGSDAGLEHPTVQIDVWALTAQSMVDISTQVKAAMQDYSGTSAAVVVQRVFLENEIDNLDYDPNTKKKIYHRAHDFVVWCEV